MCRLITLILALLFLFAAPGLPRAAGYGDGRPLVVWQAPRLGKPSAELQLGPNGLFYLAAGNKLVVVDDSGRKLGEAAGPSGGKGGRPVFDAYGSIFFPGEAMVREIKLNGSGGWDFSVYQGIGKTAARLTAGPGNLLYLPLPSALYAVDTLGHYKWVLLRWESGDDGRTRAVKDREILACAGDSRAVYVVYGEKKEGFSLVAVSGAGEVLWRRWLGGVKEAFLAAGADGRVYVTVNPARLDRLNRGKVYAFDGWEDGLLLWTHSVPYDDLTAPALSERGLLYFCAGERLYALERADGKEVWSQPLARARYHPAVDEASGRVYLGTEDERLLCVNDQGRLDWELELDGKASLQPLVMPGGYVYVVTDKGTLYKIKDQK